MSTLGQVLLWLQLCGKPRIAPGLDPEAEASLGLKGSDLRRGWDMEVAFSACLKFPVLWLGLVRPPMPRMWRNHILSPWASEPLVAQLCTSGTEPGVPGSGTPLRPVRFPLELFPAPNSSPNPADSIPGSQRPTNRGQCPVGGRGHVCSGSADELRVRQRTLRLGPQRSDPKR